MSSLHLPNDLRQWPALFENEGLDCVMDPMVVRAAELFIGGLDYCRKMTGQADTDFWPAIENNLDRVLTFFHLLMTRDRIPLIDYGQTFITELPEWVGSSVFVWAHNRHAQSATRSPRRRWQGGPAVRD